MAYGLEGTANKRNGAYPVIARGGQTVGTVRREPSTGEWFGRTASGFISDGHRTMRQAAEWVAEVTA
jgi:hypothetical protein